MSGTLSPDVIAAINQVAATPLGRKYDRMARRKYDKSGVALAAKEVLGESGGNRKAVSPAGARGLTQFMPGTRDEVLKSSGYDAYGSNADAIAAMMVYQLKRGVAGYNPGMPSYTDYILKQRLDPATNRALKRNGSAKSGISVQAPDKTSVTLGQEVIPGQSFAAERTQARQDLLTGGGLSLKKLLNYKLQMNQLQDVPARTVPGDLEVNRTPGATVKVKAASGQDVPLGGGSSSKGSFTISGPSPNRLRPELVTYAHKVARIYGGPLEGLDGSSHSKYTVNGNVSEHFTGNASDVFSIGGKKYGEEGWETELVRAGRAALIAAGMPRAQAMKQTGGLYNVGRHQIIFNVTGAKYGGNHLDHLHISTHAR